MNSVRFDFARFVAAPVMLASVLWALPLPASSQVTGCDNCVDATPLPSTFWSKWFATVLSPMLPTHQAVVEYHHEQYRQAYGACANAPVPHALVPQHSWQIAPVPGTGQPGAWRTLSGLLGLSKSYGCVTGHYIQAHHWAVEVFQREQVACEAGSQVFVSGGVVKCRSTAPPPPPPAPLGCATGTGGFFSCPGNSPPSGSPTGPAQNFGSPGEPQDSVGPEDSAQVPGMSEQPSLGAQSCRAKDAAAVGDPVHAGSGNVYHQETDYRGRGPQLVRSYNSGTPGWSHNHMVKVIASASQADVVRPDGRIQTFAGTGDGSWTSNATVRASLVRLAVGGAARWRYVNDRDEVELYDAQGMPQSITAPNGQALTYQTNGGKVLSVTNAFGRRLSFAHDAQGRIVSATLPDGQQASYRYDGQGRLDSVVFADGATRRYLYESATGPLLLTGVVDETGSRFASWSYDAQGRAISASQAGGANAAQLSYQGGATVVTDGVGGARTLRFASVGGKTVFAGQTAPCVMCSGDAASKQVDTSTGLVQESEDLLGVKTLFTWDPQRKLPLASTRAAGRPEAQSVQIQWHPSFRVPVLITQNGRSIAYTYDERGNRLSARTTDLATARDKVERWTYNGLGQVQSHTNEAGQTWQFDYDATGNLVVERDALGQQVLHAYDANGRLARTDRPGGLAVRYVYDARGRLVEEDRAGETTRFTYLQTGLLASVASADGYRVAYGYDAAQRLVSITDNRGVSIAYTLDAVGNRLREEVRGASGAIAHLTSRTANQLGRITRIEGVAGQATSIAYDVIGRAESQTDPLNHSMRIEYDALGRVTGTQFADGARATQAWDGLGHLTGVVDPKGVATGYAVDAFGEVSGETSPDIGVMQYTRDAVGSPSELRDAKGQLTRITRDALGRPTHISFADGTASRFDYTAAGFLAQVSDASGSTTFSRDAHGRVLGKTQVVNDSGSAPSTFGLAYSLAPGGAIASLRYPSGLAVQYRRDATGRIVGIDAKAAGESKRGSTPLVPLVSDIDYTALGQPASWRWSNGDAAQRSFDADGRMVANEFATYAYDAGGRIRSLTQHLRARSNAGSKAVVSTVPMTWSVEYDSRNRITGFSRPGSEAQYTYDANSNRLTAVKRRVRDSDHDGSFEGTDFARTEIQHANIDAASNRLLGLTIVKTVSPHGEEHAGDSSGKNIVYTVDANGAITSDGERQFEYDAANRLARLTLQSDGEPVHIRYLHNALGQRVFKGEPVADQAIPDAATLGAGFVDWLRSRFGWMFSQTGAATTLGTAYVWGDGDIPPWALLGEYDSGSASGKGRTEYVWLPLEGGSAIPVAFFRGGRFYAVHTDHLGSPRLVTDDAKEPVWQWPYSAFGEVEPVGVVRSGPGLSDKLKAAGSTVFDLRFPGQVRDDRLGANYNHLRDYVPAVGRFSQADPIGLRGGLNRSAYVGANALGQIDPYGLAYFGFRSLSFLPMMILMDALFDLQLAHEHLFFEDQLSPHNIGFGGKGLFTEPFPLGYVKADGGYDDCVMRMAVASYEWQGSAYKPCTNNCQNWALAVRAEYNRLIQEAAVREKCGCTTDLSSAARKVPYFDIRLKRDMENPPSWVRRVPPIPPPIGPRRLGF